MTQVRIEQLRGTGVRVWHELEVDGEGRVECPLCCERMPVRAVVEHLQPRPSGAVFPLGADDEPVRAGGDRQFPAEW